MASDEPRASGDIMSSPGEPMRQHELAAMRDERDAALAENKRLRELYENAVGNRERFGWTINHLLECEDTLAHFQVEAASFERERDEALQQRDELLKAILDALGTFSWDRPPARNGSIQSDRLAALYDTAKKIREEMGTDV